MKHIEEVQEWLANNNLDIAYISDFHNIRYYTGFDSDPIERILALFIFPDKDPFIFAPALEVGSVKESGWEYPVFGYLDHEDAFALIKSHINALAGNPKKWAVEKDNLTVAKSEAILRNFPEAKFVENISPFINKQRSMKMKSTYFSKRENGLIMPLKLGLMH